jgi:transposase-like protein
MEGAWNGTRQEANAGTDRECSAANEVAMANGKTAPAACKEAGIVEQTYYRWCKEYGGLKVDQAKRLKELEQENGKLKRLVAELSLDKQILQDIARGNF